MSAIPENIFRPRGTDTNFQLWSTYCNRAKMHKKKPGMYFVTHFHTILFLALYLCQQILRLIHINPTKLAEFQHLIFLINTIKSRLGVIVFFYFIF